MTARRALPYQWRVDELGLGSGLDIEAVRRQLRAAVARFCPGWMREEREDLVQASLLRIMEALKAREGAELKATYMWKTAYSVVLDETRRAWRRRERPFGDDGPPPVPAGATPEALQLQGEVGRAVRDCLGGLEAGRRRAVQLRLAGFGHDDAAQRLGLAVKQASNLIFRGMEDLRRCLRAKGITA